MNEMTSVTAAKAAIPAQETPPEPFRKKNGMTAEEAAYMRGGLEPVAGSVPMSTSRYLNSPLFVHAFTTMSLRRMGPDVPTTYDIPTMSRGLADVADYAEGARLVAEEKARNPVFAAWLDRRRPLRVDADAVKDCAEGTFGASLRAFIELGYKTDFVHHFEAATDLEYLMKQIGRSHDIQHIATGYGPNHAGEHALAYMNITAAYRQLSPELAGFISMANQFVSVALVARVGLHYRAGMPIILEAMRQGIEAGQKLTTLLFMVDWDDYYDWPLEKVTEQLGIARGPGDAWAYTEELCTG